MNLENYGIIFYINEIIYHMIYSAYIQILLASSLGNIWRTEWRICILMLTLCTLTSVCIFSILFSIHFLGANKENLFNNQELLQLVIIIMYSCDLKCVIQWWCSEEKLDAYHSWGIKGSISINSSVANSPMRISKSLPQEHSITVQHNANRSRV